MSAPAAGAAGLTVACVEGPAERAGLRPGDRLVAVGGRPPVDVLDLEMTAADGSFDVTVCRSGRAVTVTIDPRRGEWHGISLEGGLGSPVRTCVNRCPFCFVDQMPPGLRPSLSVRDDDYRLSFLHGNFVTLTNLDECDLARIRRLRLSPLYLSLHAWDDEVRTRLMGPRAPLARAGLERLSRAGIRFHIQIVLCPGVNDGCVLERTVRTLAGLGSVEDVGVVPVSLAREGPLRRVAEREARAALALVTDLQGDLRDALGCDFVHAADELYLTSGVLPPESDAVAQYENGIGLCAAFRRESEAAAEAAAKGSPPPLRLLTGTLAAPVVAEACARLPRARPLVVRNRLFGGHVGVTGLLGGVEVLRALTAAPLAPDEWLLAPRSFLPADLGRALDDVTEATLAAACGGRLIVTDSLQAAVRSLSCS